MKLKEISYSKLRRYLFCPRSFRFSYIDRVEPLSQGLLRVGGAIHKATELLIKEGREIGEVAGIKGIYSLLSDPVEIGDALLMFKRVSKMLENHSYLRPELPLCSRIKNLPPIVSRFDIVQPTGDFYRVIEVKSSHRIPTEQELESDFQARFYTLVAKHHVKQHPVKFAFYFVRYDTLEDVDVEPISVEELRALIDVIEEDDRYEPKPQYCYLCPYLYSCEAGKVLDTPESVAKAYLLYRAKYEEAKNRLKKVTEDVPLEIAGYWFGYNPVLIHRIKDWQEIAEEVLNKKLLVRPDLRWLKDNLPDFFKELTEKELVRVKTQTRFSVKENNEKEGYHG